MASKETAGRSGAAVDGVEEQRTGAASADAREAALELLPPVYARALTLWAAGVDQAALAAKLGVEPEAISALLDIAQAKLATALEIGSPDTRQTGG